MARPTAALTPTAFSTFGELLRYLRRRRRLTQIELAIAVGYSTAQISRLEQNQRLPNPSTLQALFVPALGLEDQPELAARLLELAHQARSEQGRVALVRGLICNLVGDLAQAISWVQQAVALLPETTTNETVGIMT
jgi:transcriptional regulator with XRE-family HTH domain